VHYPRISRRRCPSSEFGERNLEEIEIAEVMDASHHNSDAEGGEGKEKNKEGDFDVGNAGSSVGEGSGSQD